MTAITSEILNDMPIFICLGFCSSVILSFISWAIMKLWRFVVDLIKLSTSLR